MFKKISTVAVLVASSLWMPFGFTPCAQAQQTLGGITGTVTDKTGSVLPGTVVTIVGEDKTHAQPDDQRECSYDP
jgi:hypothetical protein